MSESYLLIVAGLETAQYDAVRKLSSKLLAPGGHLVMKPAAYGGLSAFHANSLISEASNVAASLAETTPLSVLTLIVGDNDEQAEAFASHFFPFALVQRVSRPVATPANRDVAFNRLKDQIVKAAQQLRKRAREVSHFTSVRWTGPLLLPLRNFREASLRELLGDLFKSLQTATDVGRTVTESIDSFHARTPKSKAPSEGRAGEKSCYSDGHLFFCSPGRERHGFFRNAGKANHSPICLLNARSRLGGHYAYDFHYDCQPVRRLLASYPNCHSEEMPPGENHVNISPNDFVK